MLLPAPGSRKMRFGRGPPHLLPYFALVITARVTVQQRAEEAGRGPEPGSARTGAARHGGQHADGRKNPEGDPGILLRYGSAIYFKKKKKKIEKLWMWQREMQSDPLLRIYYSLFTAVLMQRASH